MPSRTSPRRTTGERGAALVEFAIVLPLMVVLVFGTIDIGRAYMAWNQVKGAAREGAAYAQFHPNEAVQDTECPNPRNVEFRANGERSSNETYSVETTRADGSPLGCGGPPVPAGEEIAVMVEDDLPLLTPIASAIVGNGILMIRAKVTVVVQGQ